MFDAAALAALLLSFGGSLAASAVRDWVKDHFGEGQQVPRDELERELQAFLDVNGVKAKAATVIDLWAGKGALKVTGSSLYAPDAITMGAGKGAEFSVGDGTTTETDRTKIEIGIGASIKGSDSAVKQTPDGDITFHVGKK